MKLSAAIILAAVATAVVAAPFPNQGYRGIAGANIVAVGTTGHSAHKAISTSQRAAKVPQPAPTVSNDETEDDETEDDDEEEETEEPEETEDDETEETEEPEETEDDETEETEEPEETEDDETEETEEPEETEDDETEETEEPEETEDDETEETEEPEETEDDETEEPKTQAFVAVSGDSSDEVVSAPESTVIYANRLSALSHV
ncbi:uncharacterized protein BJ171DRAFT_599090 [Polychytrium aggregatum]|uniref:uncharacterized protein n=1 Tax=Polychytrium aggregatum TaxID=110093 RepID=UPI0022FE93DF|nr:uncharacterized protein BJ171DRAFT_599090 [Polychytrium aggregatum]KAI9204685.1 hypothetical protein BJ171DRAFT_599090 [Polychytrium aggregatum]